MMRWTRSAAYIVARLLSRKINSQINLLRTTKIHKFRPITRIYRNC
jgi:hypothetical protein